MNPLEKLREQVREIENAQAKVEAAYSSTRSDLDRLRFYDKLGIIVYKHLSLLANFKGSQYGLMELLRSDVVDLVLKEFWGEDYEDWYVWLGE